MKYFLLVLLLIVMGSCFNKGDCLKTNTDLVRIAFRRKADGRQDTILFNSILAEGFSSALVSNTTLKGGSLSLQVNPNQTKTNFIFNYTFTRNKKDSTRTDTLKLTYQPLARVPASDCGAFLYFTDLNYIKTGFDSVRIINSQLLSDATIINVQIYR